MKLNSAVPRKKARIEIIPLIDIMFFLLASFMLVSLSMIKLQAIQTNLPSANTGSNVPKPDFVAIGIDKGGNYYFDKDKDPIPPEDIPKRLQPFYQIKQENLKVFINADSDTTYASVVTALDMVRELGIKKVSFPVKKSNHFDPLKPRANTTSDLLPGGAPGAPGAPAAPAGAAPAGGAPAGAAPVPAAPPAAPTAPPAAP